MMNDTEKTFSTRCECGWRLDTDDGEEAAYMLSLHQNVCDGKSVSCEKDAEYSQLSEEDMLDWLNFWAHLSSIVQAELESIGDEIERRSWL